MSNTKEEGCFTLTWEIKNFSHFLAAAVVKDRSFKGELNSPTWKTVTTSGISQDFFMSVTDEDSRVSVQLLVHGDIVFYPKFEISIISFCDETPLNKIGYDNFLIEENSIFDDNGQSTLLNGTLTLCCRVWSKTMETGMFRINSELHAVNWKQDNFFNENYISSTFIEKENLLFYMTRVKKNEETDLIIGGVSIREANISFVDCKVSVDEAREIIGDYDFPLRTTWHGRLMSTENSSIGNLQLKMESIVAVQKKSVAVHPSSSTLSYDLQHLYKDGLYSDVTIRTEGKSFSAHRNILAARSPVFRAMLEKNQMSEACLTVDNACDLLVLADAHSDEQLMSCVVDFIRHNNEVVSSPRWEELEESNPRLTSKIVRKLFLRSITK